MHIQLGICLLVIPCALAIPRPVSETADRLSRKCKSERNSSVLEEYESRFERDRAKVELSASADLDTPVLIDVYFHTIVPESGSASSNGAVSNEQIYDQMEVLNADYASTGLVFRLVSIEKTINEDWFRNGGPGTAQQDEMKQVLRKGGASDLNVYTVEFTGDWAGLLGYSTFPVLYHNNPSDDGVVILYSTLPGGVSVPYNLGRTLTHELGHWAGLYHTFQGESCSDINGDYVSDTPQEASPASGCLIDRDSCPLLEGIDPIHNFMDYSDDYCMNNFTPGQATRMKAQLTTYRNGRLVARATFEGGVSKNATSNKWLTLGAQ